MKLFVLTVNFSISLFCLTSCTKTDLTMARVPPVTIPTAPPPVAVLYPPHIDVIYEELAATDSAILFIAGQHFNGVANVYIDRSKWINFLELPPLGTTPPYNEVALAKDENWIPETPTGVHEFQVLQGNLYSNVFPYVFTPELAWYPIEVKPGQPFEVVGRHFGNRTLPSTLQIFDVTNGQQRLLTSPTITSWGPKAIDLISPRYLHANDPLGLNQSPMILKIVLTVSGKTTSKLLNYQF